MNYFKNKNLNVTGHAKYFLLSELLSRQVLFSMIA